MVRRWNSWWALSLLVLTIGLGTSPGHAQQSVFAGSEEESYLRNLQLAGKSPLHPWSVRPFSMAEVERLLPADTLHPWAERFLSARLPTGGPGAWLLPVELTTVLNSGFPYGANQREVWAGRGVTSAVRFGAAGRWGPLSLVLAPVAYASQNASFGLTEHEDSDELPFNDWRQPQQIDHPQRPGDGPFGRVHPGQSTLRLDAGPLTLGLSTANQVWGPAAEYPLLVGTNAPGFVHGFAGTALPVNLGIGRLHGRVVWGRLEETEFSPMPPDSSVRFMTGVHGTFTPRGVEGLELGFARFFHLHWPEDGPRRAHFLRVFETFLKNRLVGEDDQYLVESVVSNQLASVFGRWVFPASGFEVYGEFATEDHRHNLRDFILQPDHSTAWTLGVRRLWGAEGDEFWLARGELLNATRSHLHRTRRQEYFYIHANRRQGHTHQGQIIGSPAALGGGGLTLALDRYHAGGRRTLTFTREVRYNQGDFRETGEFEAGDALHALGGEVLTFRGGLEWLAGLRAVVNLNHDNSGSHRFSLNATLGARYHFR